MANESNPSLFFHHVAVYVKDFEREKEFFINGLGLKPYTSWRNGERISMLFRMDDGGMLGLFSHGSDEKPANPRLVHFAVQVDDVVNSFERAVSAGAARLREPVTVTLDSSPVRLTVQSAFVRTPGGVDLEFFRMVKEEKV